MKKKIAIMLLIAILATMCAAVGLLSACSKIQYNVAYAESFSGETVQFVVDYDEIEMEINNFAEKADTLDQLKELSKEKELSCFDEDSKYYNSQFSEKIRSYGSEFFADKSLIMVLRIEPNYTGKIVKNLKVKGDTLFIDLVRPSGDYHSYDVVTTYVYLAEVDKKFVENTKYIIVEEKNNSEENFAEKVATLEQLKVLSDEKDLSCFDEDSINYNSKFSDKVRSYGSEFFENKSLIVVLRLEPSNSARSEIKKLKVKGDTMFIDLVRPSGKHDSCILTAFVYLIEVDKSAVENVKHIAVEENNN